MLNAAVPVLKIFLKDVSRLRTFSKMVLVFEIFFQVVTTLNLLDESDPSVKDPLKSGHSDKDFFPM